LRGCRYVYVVWMGDLRIDKIGCAIGGYSLFLGGVGPWTGE